jgi:hypothetical protein
MVSITCSTWENGPRSDSPQPNGITHVSHSSKLTRTEIPVLVPRLIFYVYRYIRLKRDMLVRRGIVLSCFTDKTFMGFIFVDKHGE